MEALDEIIRNDSALDSKTSRKRRGIIRKAGVFLAGIGVLSTLAFSPIKAEERDFPKVSSSNSSWYLIENQPASAITQSIDKTDITLQIGNIKATINDMPYTLDAAPYIKNSRTMLPVRFIAEGLDSAVSWDALERKVTIDYDSTNINLWIGKSTATVNGLNYTLDSPPEIKNSRTFVPIRFIAENSGAAVSWDNATREVSIVRTRYGAKSINQNSDADSDGLTFSAEKILGTNPNNKNTVYTTLTDKAISDILKQYPGTNFFSDTPDGRCDLTLPEKIALSLDPRKAFNIDFIVDDEFALRYAASRGLSKTKENAANAISGIIPSYGEKLGNAVKLAMGTRILAPEKADASAVVAKAQVETSYSLRAYKEGTTLDALTSSERYKTLMLLNNAFGEQEINLLLSQSTTLQKGDITKYSDLIKTLTDASNATEASLGKKVKETNTFKQYVNQLGLYDYNAGELAVKMWDGASTELKEQIKAHPKWALSIVSGFAPFVSGKDAQNSEILDLVVNYAKEHFSYHVETEKILNDLADKENDADLRRPLEGFDWMTLQFLLPNQSWTNAENVEKLPDLKSKLENTFNYIENLKTIRDNAIQNFHDVSYVDKPSIKIDLLSNWLGSGSIDYVIYGRGNAKTGTQGKTPWGEYYTKKVTTSKEWPITTDLEIAKKIAYLFSKGKEKITDNERILIDSMKGWAQVERIINMALNFPTMEVRNRGPPVTLSEDNVNNLWGYKFNKDELPGFTGVIAFNIERVCGETLVHANINTDYFIKIKFPNTANSEKPSYSYSGYFLIRKHVAWTWEQNSFNIEDMENNRWGQITP
jgi:hypothetical protein